MKKLAVLALLFMLAIPVLPMALADNSVNVVLTTGENTVTLNIICDVAENGTMQIHINAFQGNQTLVNQTIVNEYTTVNEYHEHNYDSDIAYLNQKIGGVEFTLFALANYTDGKLSMLLVNDNCLVKWIGCLDNTTLIGRRIFDGNSTVVMELDRLTNDDATLLDMITRLTEQMDSRLTMEKHERILLAVAMGDLVGKLRTQSATKIDLEITNKNLMDTTNELTILKTQFEQLRLVLMALGALVIGVGIAWIAGSIKE